ncbi:hydroxyisourate hydrolase [Micromonospora andamanensis]|uniref:Transthyretin/hydroxyisourate hydrolase domain-containing protein n=1 Tax=Micromonospora andamanensis TaxID=1287068 RepID=A0ABQ4HTE2_9ACTN|nr:hydroxyisourate hydrolase [Micromonospora andamanensis]GIJ08912.1 hypothetical protein Van01_21260 [Micromonospora andamanensis]
MAVSARALDGVLGRPAAGLRIRFERDDNGWRPIAWDETDSDGFVLVWPASGPRAGAYRLVLDCDHYFVGLGLIASYPAVVAVFRVADEVESYHLEVVLAPAAYSVCIAAY